MDGLDYRQIKKTLQPVSDLAKVNAILIREMPLYETPEHDLMAKIRQRSILANMKEILNQAIITEETKALKEFIKSFEAYIKEPSEQNEKMARGALLNLFDFIIFGIEKIKGKIEKLAKTDPDFIPELICIINSLDVINDANGFFRSMISSSHQSAEAERGHLNGLLNAYLGIAFSLREFPDKIKQHAQDASMVDLSELQISVSRSLRRLKASFATLSTVPFSPLGKEVANGLVGCA